MSIRNGLLSRFFVPVLAVLGSSAIFAHAVPQNRVRTIADANRSPVRETISPRARRSVDLGEASLGRMLSISLHFNLTDAQQADLSQLLADQQNPASPHYHQWLTPQQYGARFGLSSADLSKVTTWLSGKGLKIVAVAPSQNSVTVSGTIGQVENALNTRIHSLSENGTLHISNMTDPQLPDALAKVVSGITGLNDFKLRPHAIVRPHFTSSMTGVHFIAPGDFYAIYNLNPLLQQQSINGSGINIAVVGRTDISLADVAAFRSASGLPSNPPKIIPATGYVPGIVKDDIDEAQLDVEWSGAAAPNATINFVTVGSASNKDVIDSLFFAIANNIAPIITMSYGSCEATWGQSSLSVISQELQQANAQGITVFGASGDAGATDCETVPPADLGLAVDFPASSPFVTAAGGTMFNEGNATGSTQYWNSNGTSSNNGGSATGYIPEVVWNETTSSSTQMGATGGGASSFFTKPFWQVGTGVPSDQARDVPDISLNAASSHDGYLFCSQGSCTNGFRDSQGNLNVVGGTSVVSPSLGGIFALLEQQLGTRLGNINPTLYSLANSPYASAVFHDVTAGNNNSPCQMGTTNCPNGGTIGYPANTGYDLATGWGSLDVASMASKWTAVSPLVPGEGTPSGTALSATQVSTSSTTTCGVAGTFALTISVANASTNSMLGTPTGNVQIMLDGKAISGAVVPLSNGTATYSYTPDSGLSSGNHTFSAIYQGDASFAGSQSTTTADFVSPSQKDFSLTPCAASALALSGSSAQGITFTLAPVNGFTGTVSFTISADQPLAATYALSPINITSNAPVTASLVLTASQSKSQTSNTLALTRSRPVSSYTEWYARGSGATLACLFLLAVPKRRRWTPLIVLLFSVAAISVSGCGGGGGSSGGSGNNNSGTTNATPGTYTLNVTATSGTLVHTSTVTFKVQ